jgi:Pvc16 N-terminal domain/Carboxypeptidase regulatory-like domain
MIRDLSETLQGILSQPGLPAELQAAQISFDRPQDPFSLTQTTIDVFLFDIRENVTLRFTDYEQRTVGQTVFLDRPPLRLTCSYLITAWPVGVPDISLAEHLLLSQVVQLLSKYPLIPASFLQGSLVGQTPPVQMQIAHPDDMRNAAEFWAAVGNKLRASIVAAATITMPVFDEQQYPKVITSQMASEIIDSPATVQPMFRIGGIVTDAATAPVAGATVRIVETGRLTTTGTAGDFTLSALPAGVFTLQATSGTHTRSVAITIPAPAGSNYDVQLP